MDLDVVRSNSELHPADADVSDFEDGGTVGVVVVHHLVTAMLVAMALALGTWGYLTFRNASFFELPDRRTSPFERSAVDAQVDRFHFALDVYFALYSKYPASLEEVVDEGLLDSTDLNYPPGSSTILYRRTGDTYQIVVEREFVKGAEDESAEGRSTEEKTPPHEATEEAPPAPESDQE
jgi:hypothetical protein